MSGIPSADLGRLLGKLMTPTSNGHAMPTSTTTIEETHPLIIRAQELGLTVHQVCVVDIDGQLLLYVWMDVSPALATEFLVRNTRNRNEKVSTINAVSDDMEEGAFRFNGDTIRFDWDDVLIDGQNRLKAILKSGVTVPACVILGLDPEVMDTIDQGIVRTTVDILATSGHRPPNVGLIASAAAILMRGNQQLARGGRDRKRIAAYAVENLDYLTEMCRWAKKVSDISPVVEAIRYGNNQKCLSASPLAALRIHMAAQGADDDLVVDFFEKLSGLTNIPTMDEHRSYQVIRSWLVKQHPLIRDGGTQFPRMLAVCAMLVRSYNRMADAESIGRMGKFEADGYRWFSDLPIPVI